MVGEGAGAYCGSSMRAVGAAARASLTATVRHWSRLAGANERCCAVAETDSNERLEAGESVCGFLPALLLAGEFGARFEARAVSFAGDGGAGSHPSEPCLAHGDAGRRLQSQRRDDAGDPYKVVDMTDAASVDQATAWWEELTGRGGEGMVVKPLDFVAHGRRGLVQPAIKCRGSGVSANYLRAGIFVAGKFESGCGSRMWRRKFSGAAGICAGD